MQGRYALLRRYHDLFGINKIILKFLAASGIFLMTFYIYIEGLIYYRIGQMSECNCVEHSSFGAENNKMSLM